MARFKKESHKFICKQAVLAFRNMVRNYGS